MGSQSMSLGAGESSFALLSESRRAGAAERRGTPGGWMLTLQEQKKTSVSCADRTDAGRELR